MVRVALDVTPLLGARTGVGTFVEELVTGFRSVEAEVAPKAKLESNPETDLNNEAINLRTFAVTWRGRNTVTGLSRTRPMPARPLRALWLRFDHPTIEHWTGPVDVVHGTNFVVPPSSTGAEIVSVHDITFLRFPEFCTSDTQEYPKLIRRALRRGAHIHTDSRFVADEVIGYLGCPPDRVHVVPLASSVGPAEQDLTTAAPNQSMMSDERDFLLGRHELDSNNSEAVPASFRDRPFVLALGTVEPRKDLPTLLRAFALIASSLPDLQLVVAGQDGWGTDAYERAFASLPVSIRSRVHRLGYVSNWLRRALLESASVFAYPSVYEGFGLSPLEAMAFGIPVVTTDAGSLPEVLGQAAEYVCVGDAAALAAAIERVLTNESQRKVLKQQGPQRAALYSRDLMIANFSRLYRDLADNTSKRTRK